MIILLVFTALLMLLLATAGIATHILSRDDMPVGRQPRTAQLRSTPSGHRYDRSETVQFSRIR